MGQTAGPTHQPDAVAFLDRQDGSHTGHTIDATSIEPSSGSHPRRRRRLHASDRSTRPSSSNTNERSSRKTAHKRRQPSSPHSHRSPKQEQSSSFKPTANASDEPRSFLPSLSRILESSPGIGAGRWDTSTMPEAPYPPSTGQQEYCQGPHRTARRKDPKSRMRGLTSPSMNSILSTMTARTGSSSGSGSTVTQRSYESSRSQKTKHTTNGAPALERRIGSPTMRYDRDRHRSPEKLNVFKFMIQDDAGEDRPHDIDEPLWQSDSSSSSDEDNLRPQRPFTPTSSATRDSSESPSMSFKQIRAAPHMAGSLHSDSGISVQGSSSDCSDRADKPSYDTSASGAIAETHQAATALPSDYTALHYWQQRRSSNTSGCSGYQYAHPDHPAMPSMSSMIPYKTPQRDDSLPPAETKTSSSSKPGSSNPFGYDLLASELTSASSRPEPDGIVPLYRKFERLNHRILLHLQDEVCEMEEQLEQLDRYIATKSEHDIQPQPASRRRGCRHGSEHEMQRTELLGRIFLKMKQYNKAISGHSSMAKAGHPATSQEVETYRSRMKDTQLVTEEETRFLDHVNDLVRLPGRHLQDVEKPEASSSGIMIVGFCMSFFFGASLSLHHFWLAFFFCAVGLAWLVRSGFAFHSKLAA